MIFGIALFVAVALRVSYGADAHVKLGYHRAPNDWEVTYLYLATVRGDSRFCDKVSWRAYTSVLITPDSTPWISLERSDCYSAIGNCDEVKTLTN